MENCIPHDEDWFPCHDEHRIAYRNENCSISRNTNVFERLINSFHQEEKKEEEKLEKKEEEKKQTFFDKWLQQLREFCAQEVTIPIATISTIEEDWHRICNGGMIARVQADLDLLQRWNRNDGRDVVCTFCLCLLLCSRVTSLTNTLTHLSYIPFSYTILSYAPRSLISHTPLFPMFSYTPLTPLSYTSSPPSSSHTDGNELFSIPSRSHALRDLVSFHATVETLTGDITVLERGQYLSPGQVVDSE